MNFFEFEINLKIDLETYIIIYVYYCIINILLYYILGGRLIIDCKRDYSSIELRISARRNNPGQYKFEPGKTYYVIG